MRIGLDFDNTIVCYDQAIALLAEELFELPTDLPRTKLALRDFLRTTRLETEWTAFQGELYGPGMRYAQPFEGAIRTMQELVSAGHELVIISHRSRLPYAGPPHDLHAAARRWVAERLQTCGLFGGGEFTSSVNFLESRHDKLALIADLNCKAFLDDLPEVLTDSGFPSSAVGILFDRSGAVEMQADNLRITAWVELPGLLAQLS